jgi:hypothetical protein
MDVVKKALKYPFKKLYAFGVFAIEAKSTMWPGVSRFSVSRIPLSLPTKSRIYLPQTHITDGSRYISSSPPSSST